MCITYFFTNKLKKEKAAKAEERNARPVQKQPPGQPQMQTSEVPAVAPSSGYAGGGEEA